MSRLRALLIHPEFRRGAREMIGAAIGIGAWGLVTGVAMVKSGLGVELSLLMTFVVFAGSAQLAALPLLVSGAPLWVILAAALCVNLRFLVYSAQWRPYFANLSRRHRLVLSHFMADPIYVLFLRRFPTPAPAAGQLPYFWGGALVNWFGWQLPSVLGILLADAVPTASGIGFAGTLALLALLLSLLTDRTTRVAAAIAGCAAVATYWMPLKLNILVGIAAAVAIGLLIDRARPKAPLPFEQPGQG